MKLETRLRLESGFNDKLKVQLYALRHASIKPNPDNTNTEDPDIDVKVRELVTYIRLQINTAYKLGMQAGAQKND